MANAIEKAIVTAMGELFGDDHAPAEPKRPMRDPLRLKAVAAAPDQDDDAVDLIERYLTLDWEISGFAGSIDQLITKHAGDRRFEERCRNALAARADLVDLQQRELLRAYYPPLKLICLPN